MKQVALPDRGIVPVPVVWPQKCCSCLGPAEKFYTTKDAIYNKWGRLVRTIVWMRDVPYCKKCFPKGLRDVSGRTFALGAFIYLAGVIGCLLILTALEINLNFSLGGSIGGIQIDHILGLFTFLVTITATFLAAWFIVLRYLGPPVHYSDITQKYYFSNHEYADLFSLANQQAYEAAVNKFQRSLQPNVHPLLLGEVQEVDFVDTELVTQETDTYGHQFVEGVCRKCGSSQRAVEHFKWPCKKK